MFLFFFLQERSARKAPLLTRFPFKSYWSELLPLPPPTPVTSCKRCSSGRRKLWRTSTKDVLFSHRHIPPHFFFPFLHWSSLGHLRSRGITCCRGWIAAAAPDRPPFFSLQLQQLFVRRSPLLFPFPPPHDITVCSTKQEQHCTSWERSF